MSALSRLGPQSHNTKPKSGIQRWHRQKLDPTVAKGCDEPISFIPSRMKRRIKLEVTPSETLVVKQHTVVFTNQSS